MLERNLMFAAPILLALAVPAAPLPAPAATASVEQAAVEKARADKAERDLAIQTAVRESEDRESDRAFSAIESMIGAFGVLITLIVIFFALRTEQAAVAAARFVLVFALSWVDELQKQAQAASETAKGAAAKAAEAHAKAEAAAVNASEALGTAEAAAKGAAGEHDRARELQRQAALIVENMKSGGAGADQPPLTRKQSETLRAAAEESATTSTENWSVDQFKAAIGKAMYVDEDWLTTTQLASEMARVHAKDRDARAYAYCRRGDAEIKLSELEKALRSFELAVSAAGARPT